MQVSSLRFSIGLGSLLAVLILGSVYAAFIPLGDDNQLSDELLPRDIVGESQAHCLALAIYFEGGSTSEAEVGQRHIARVVVERAKANLRKWGGSDLCDVVFYKKAGVCQFSFACLPLDAYNETALKIDDCSVIACFLGVGQAAFPSGRIPP